MSDSPPGGRPSFQSGQEGDGKIAALVAWALYILSIPSANLLVIVGLIVAYASRATATGVRGLISRRRSPCSGRSSGGRLSPLSASSSASL